MTCKPTGFVSPRQVQIISIRRKPQAIKSHVFRCHDLNVTLSRYVSHSQTLLFAIHVTVDDFASVWEIVTAPTFPLFVNCVICMFWGSNCCGPRPHLRQPRNTPRPKSSNNPIRPDAFHRTGVVERELLRLRLGDR